MGLDYPSKPMALYATIWDASSWATNGGKLKADYKYAPFVSDYKDLVLEGCPVDPIEEFPFYPCYESDSRLDNKDYAVITPAARAKMRWFRRRYMYYSYCYDAYRYPVTLPECVIDPDEQIKFKENGRLKPKQFRRRNPRKRRAVPTLTRVEVDVPEPEVEEATADDD